MKKVKVQGTKHKDQQKEKRKIVKHITLGGQIAEWSKSSLRS